MPLTTRRWKACAALYRALVVAQTLAWAVETLLRISTRHSHSPPAAQPSGMALAIASVAGIAGGLLTYRLLGSRSDARDAAVLAWPWFQVAGVVALVGYAITGSMLNILVGVITLAVMHAFSPNRFQTDR